jgi:hypothetical protein
MEICAPVPGSSFRIVPVPTARPSVDPTVGAESVMVNVSLGSDSTSGATGTDTYFTTGVEAFVDAAKLSVFVPEKVE